MLTLPGNNTRSLQQPANAAGMLQFDTLHTGCCLYEGTASATGFSTLSEIYVCSTANITEGIQKPRPHTYHRFIQVVLHPVDTCIKTAVNRVGELELLL